MIDSHCHLNASYTLETLPPVMDQFIKFGGTAVVDVTTELKDLPILESFVAAYPKIIFASIGVHPEYCNTDRPKDVLTELQECIEKAEIFNNLVALGETGLDYGSLPEDLQQAKKAIDTQRELLVGHINAAKKLQLPLVIHARGKSFDDYSPYLDVLNVLAQENFSGPVYFHSFGGDIACARKILDRGYKLGVNGISTYSNAKTIAESVGYIPLDSILLETDSPFLIPSNMDRSLLQSAKVNEPVGIVFVGKRVAALKNIPIEDILQTTEQNAKSFFAKIP